MASQLRPAPGLRCGRGPPVPVECSSRPARQRLWRRPMGHV